MKSQYSGAMCTNILDLPYVTFLKRPQQTDTATSWAVHNHVNGNLKDWLSFEEKIINPIFSRRKKKIWAFIFFPRSPQSIAPVISGFQVQYQAPADTSSSFIACTSVRPVRGSQWTYKGSVCRSGRQEREGIVLEHVTYRCNLQHAPKVNLAFNIH